MADVPFGDDWVELSLDGGRPIIGSSTARAGDAAGTRTGGCRRPWGGPGRRQFAGTRDVRTMLWFLRYNLLEGELWVELADLKRRLRPHHVSGRAVEENIRKAERQKDLSPYFHTQVEGMHLWVQAVPATGRDDELANYSPTSPAESAGAGPVYDSDDEWGEWNQPKPELKPEHGHREVAAASADREVAAADREVRSRGAKARTQPKPELGNSELEGPELQTEKSELEGPTPKSGAAAADRKVAAASADREVAAADREVAAAEQQQQTEKLQQQQQTEKLQRQLEKMLQQQQMLQQQFEKLQRLNEKLQGQLDREVAAAAEFEAVAAAAEEQLLKQQKQCEQLQLQLQLRSQQLQSCEKQLDKQRELNVQQRRAPGPPPYPPGPLPYPPGPPPYHR